jgi:hypothetical protein
MALDSNSTFIMQRANLNSYPSRPRLCDMSDRNAATWAKLQDRRATCFVGAVLVVLEVASNRYL